MVLTKNHLYWLLQLGGWSLYCLISYLSAPLFNMDLPYFWIMILMSLFNGILVTHLFRLIIKRSEWITLPLGRLMLFLPLATMVMLFAYAAIQSLLGIIYMIFIAVADTDALQEMIKQSGINSLSENYWGILFLSYLNVYAMLLIWTLGYYIYHYFENLQREKIKQMAYENKLREAQMNNLKAQLNPHFLFNSLNSIRALTHSDAKMASSAISKLSDLLRASINASETRSITLKQELKLVADYLDIEKIRFDDRLEFEMQIDPHTEQVMIPPLIIQTLVENAVKHGIGKLVQGGTITIKSFIKNNKLCIEVLNPGEFVAAVDTEGYGLQNIKRRLWLLFGDNAVFSVNSFNENQVLAQIELPIA